MRREAGSLVQDSLNLRWLLRVDNPNDVLANVAILLDRGISVVDVTDGELHLSLVVRNEYERQYNVALVYPNGESATVFSTIVSKHTVEYTRFDRGRWAVELDAEVNNGK